MGKLLIIFFLLWSSITLTACSSLESLTSYTFHRPVSQKNETTQKHDEKDGTFVNTSGNPVAVATITESNQALGGEIAQHMDEIDKSKLNRALDNPLGKPTHWTNGNTGINYTVATTEKITIKDNSLCRKYQATSEKNNKIRHVNGIACISTDGNWHAVSMN